MMGNSTLNAHTKGRLKQHLALPNPELNNRVKSRK